MFLKNVRKAAFNKSHNSDHNGYQSSLILINEMSLLSHSTHDHATSSLDDLLKIANPVRAGALAAFNVTAHPDEVLQIPSRDEGRFIRIHAYNTVNRDAPV
ncbi:hypothetical protein ASPFODRAFT_53415 [Aspergillus luchuensis CBS 106.47]|uniref:Uncharacterized protein n=1 Tax=Aspergillus luchuensis (strain CBS 106.47) TaxID=1137211 RepID=A0A1M3T0Q6_ASPLC|nr:hypothetical protein ASPFODRAFT_53415 [Aspergillus luchuensis CBS 106.47]